jgi:hypothetical protein
MDVTRRFGIVVDFWIIDGSLWVDLSCGWSFGDGWLWGMVGYRAF